MLKFTADWRTPLACIAVVLLSTLYTHHTHHQKLRDCSDLPLLQELVCIQIAGIILASAAISATKRAAPLTTTMLSHPMLPRAAERKRMQLPLV